MAADMRREVERLLDASEVKIRDEIERRLDTVVDAAGVDLGKGTQALRRLQYLEDVIAKIRGDAIQAAADHVSEQMQALARHEAEFAAMTIHDAVPAEVDLTLPSADALESMVETDPMQGNTLQEWAERIKQDDTDRISDAVRLGLIAGDDTDAISRAVLGLQSLDGSDGVTQITRNSATALARTAVNHFSNAAKQALYAENEDIIAKELFHATLDSRTTVECASLDGNEYDVGDGPVPPLHWQCRSVRVPVIGGELIGDRPAKPTVEADLVGEYADQQELGDITSREGLPHGHKGKYDEFASKRIRELTGPVPATTTYAEFLGRQSVAFQDEVLGKTKGILFRKGGLKLDRFTTRTGAEKTLAELVKSEREAFVRAGLDPADFATK